MFDLLDHVVRESWDASRTANYCLLSAWQVVGRGGINLQHRLVSGLLEGHKQKRGNGRGRVACSGMGPTAAEQL